MLDRPCHTASNGGDPEQSQNKKGKIVGITDLGVCGAVALGESGCATLVALAILLYP